MGEDDYKVTGFKKWHDVRLQPDGSVQEITRIRFWIGSHGPFEKTFEREASDSDVGQAIERERQSLRTLSSY